MAFAAARFPSAMAGHSRSVGTWFTDGLKPQAHVAQDGFKKQLNTILMARASWVKEIRAVCQVGHEPVNVILGQSEFTGSGTIWSIPRPFRPQLALTL